MINRTINHEDVGKYIERFPPRELEMKKL